MTVNSADNTPLDADAVGQEGDDNAVDWDAATEFITGQEPEEEVYLDEQGNQLTPEEVEAAKAEGAVIEEEEDEEEEGEDDAELVEVRIKGRTLSLPREDAEAIEAFRRDHRNRDGRLGSELQQARERLAALEALVQQGGRAGDQTAGPVRPDPNLGLKDFPKYAQLQDEYIDHKIASAVSGLVEAYNRDLAVNKAALMEEQSNRAWVSGFYSEHPHLNKPAVRLVVGQVYKENSDELAELTDEDPGAAYDRLAVLAEERLVELTRSGRQLRKPPRMEGASPSSNRRAKPASPRVPFDTAAWIAEERERMRG